MKKKLFKVLFVLSVLAMLFTLFTFTNATTIEETTKTNDGKDTIAEKTIIIGVTKFTPGTSITAAKAAKAGANDYKIYLAQNKDTEKYTDPVIYYYVGDDIWFIIDEDGEAEPIDAIESLDIYYVDNEPKKEVSIPVANEQGEYTLTFMNDSKVFESQEVKEGEKATSPKTNPSKTGYTFLGWYADEKAFDFSTPINQDTVLVANWELNKYTVTFLDEDGKTALYSNDFEYGTDLNEIFRKEIWSNDEIQIPYKEDTAQYSYYWSWDKELEVVEADATYTLVWEESLNAYEINFIKGDEQVDSIYADYGEVPEFKGTTPVKPETAEYSYEFVGWDPEIVAVTGPATYKAKFNQIPNEYTITYLVDGEQYGEVETVAYGADVIEREAPTKEGYTFSGWTGFSAVMPAKNVEVTGTFTINKINIQ